MPADAAFTLDSDWPELQKALRKWAPEARRAMNKAIRQSANGIKSDAARGFKQYSNRIHKGLGVQVTQKHVAINLSAKKAPHGPINERGGRHPVYGNRRVWVEQEPRPRLGPAVERGKPKVRDDIADAVIEAARQTRVIRRR